MHTRKYQHLSITKQLNFQDDYIPPYCPNPRCKYHRSGVNFFHKNGWTTTKKKPFNNRRYKCKYCRIQFSFNTFSLDFRRRSCNLFFETHARLNEGMTNNSIARTLSSSEQTIRMRIAELSRQSMLVAKSFEENLSHDEPIAYDGFESFCNSQYSPNYINTAVGMRSLYIFPETYSYLNRKGRMTNDQKNKNTEIIKEYGRYPKNSIRVETTNVIKYLLATSFTGKITLNTDGHCSYHASIFNDFSNGLINHKITSSREVRDGKNSLWAINHLHGLYRHFLSSHRRETISFHKNEAGLMDRITIFRIYKNFMRPQLIRSKRNKRFNTHSPAMMLGLTNKILSFDEVFPYRRMKTQFDLTPQESDQYHRIWEHSRENIKNYSGN